MRKLGLGTMVVLALVVAPLAGCNTNKGKADGGGVATVGDGGGRGDGGAVVVRNAKLIKQLPSMFISAIAAHPCTQNVECDQQATQLLCTNPSPGASVCKDGYCQFTPDPFNPACFCYEDEIQACTLANCPGQVGGCQTGFRVCEPLTANTVQWSSCQPQAGCPGDGEQLDCDTGDPNCPKGLKTFTCAAGWSACVKPNPCGVQCGHQGEACCSAPPCFGALACVANTCQPCGADTQPCCEGGACFGAAVCVNSNCAGCGVVGQPCCTGGSCFGGGVCQAGSCVACGGRTQPCCAGESCGPSLTCQGGTCGPCGGTGQKCCPGSTCTGSNVCIDGGTCAHCGKKGERCCLNGACATQLVCGSDGKCSPATVCTDPTKPNLCGTTCVNFQTDNANCGKCNNPCSVKSKCKGGKCVCMPICGNRCDIGDGCGGTCRCVDAQCVNHRCAATECKDPREIWCMCFNPDRCAGAGACLKCCGCMINPDECCPGHPEEVGHVPIARSLCGTCGSLLAACRAKCNGKADCLCQCGNVSCQCRRANCGEQCKIERCDG